jgi:hypothetical protein
MRLSAEAERRLIENMRKPLALMHLLLRTHGWKPETSGPETWRWKRRGCPSEIRTGSISVGPDATVPCSEYRLYLWERKYTTVAGLRRRLKKLAKEVKIPLTEKHLLLRKHGWTSKHQRWGGWDWTHPDHTLRIVTYGGYWIAKWWTRKGPTMITPSASVAALATFIGRLPGLAAKNGYVGRHRVRKPGQAK